MSFSLLPIEVKEQIVAHLPFRTRMSLRQCSRIDRHVVAISKTVVESMYIISECVVMCSSSNINETISSYSQKSREHCQSTLNNKLKHFLKIVGNRFRVEHIILYSTCESTFNFIRQLNWDRIERIDINPSSPEDLVRFFEIIGNREFNLELEADAGDSRNFSNIERMYEARSLKLDYEHTFNDEYIQKFKNLRRFDSRYSGYLSIRTVRTFIRRWIEKEEVEYHYFYLNTNSRFDPVVHVLYLDVLFEGLEVQKVWKNGGFLYIEKTNSEVGRLIYEQDNNGKIKISFEANIQLKWHSEYGMKTVR